jgi:hypothetical protein
MVASENEREVAGTDQREIEWHLAATDLSVVQRWISEQAHGIAAAIQERSDDQS